MDPQGWGVGVSASALSAWWPLTQPTSLPLFLPGLSLHTFHGNFFVRSTDLLSLPNVNPDHGYTMNIAIDDSLKEIGMVCFQAALLYTSSRGERIGERGLEGKGRQNGVERKWRHGTRRKERENGVGRHGKRHKEKGKIMGWGGWIMEGRRKERDPRIGVKKE